MTRERKPVVAGELIGLRIWKRNTVVADRLNDSGNPNEEINRILEEYYRGGWGQEPAQPVLDPSALDIGQLSAALLSRLEPGIRSLISSALTNDSLGQLAAPMNEKPNALNKRIVDPERVNEPVTDRQQTQPLQGAVKSLSAASKHEEQQPMLKTEDEHAAASERLAPSKSESVSDPIGEEISEAESADTIQEALAGMLDF